MLRASILCIVLFAASCNAYPFGAPMSSCTSMFPSHGVSSQDLDSSPYEVTAVVDPSDASNVTVTVTGNVPFRGILLQSRTTTNGNASGTWDLPSGTAFQSLDCNDAVNSALTHTSEDDKMLPMEFTWNAPDLESATNFQIYATIVRNTFTFYVKLSGGEITIQPSSQEPTAAENITALTTVAPTTLSPTTHAPTTHAPTTHAPTTTSSASTTSKDPGGDGNQITFSGFVLVTLLASVFLIQKFIFGAN